MHRTAGSNLGPCSRPLKLSLCQPSSRWVPFLFRKEEGSEGRGIGSAFHMLCPKYSGPLPHKATGQWPFTILWTLYFKTLQHTAIHYHTAIILICCNLLKRVLDPFHLNIMSHTERTWVVRIYVRSKGAYTYRLWSDCAGSHAERSFCWLHIP